MREECLAFLIFVKKMRILMTSLRLAFICRNFLVYFLFIRARREEQAVKMRLAPILYKCYDN